MGSHTRQSEAHADNHLHCRRGHQARRHQDQKQPDSWNGEKKSEQAIPLKAKPSTVTLRIPRWLYCYVPVLSTVVVPIACLWVASYYYSRVDNLVIHRMDTVGWEMVDLFGNFDTDGDFSLSFDEALPLLKLMSEYKHVLNESGLKTEASPDENVVELEAHFFPLNLSTMTKDWAHDFNSNYSFHGLFEWQSPNMLRREFPVSTFLDLLPENLSNIPKPGTVYQIISPPGNVYNVMTPVGRSTRHYPPQPSGRGRTVHGLLSMFHPRPFVIMRFAPQGALGCVRAVSKTHVHVLFRVHAEFQLNEPPRDPFWFSPAQFTGSLLMARNGSSVEHFHLYVPAERRLNVDMEWLMEEGNPDSMEVDIGYMPLMELVSLGRSRPQSKAEGQETDKREVEPSLDEPANPEKFKWDRQISEEAAKDAMERAFFPFKTVRYYNVSEAFDRSAASGKLVHSILLLGALDDQSC